MPAPTVLRPARDEDGLASDLCGAFIDQILKKRSLRLGMKFDATVLIALAMHSDGGCKVITINYVRKSKPADFAATNTGVKHEQQDRRVAQSVDRLSRRDVNHASHVGSAEASLSGKFRLLNFPHAERT